MKVFGVFDYDLILTLPALTAFLWSAGGTGVKALRRFGVPLVLAAFAWQYGLNGWPLAVYVAGVLGVIGFGPGYGDDLVQEFKSLYWPYIFVLGFVYGFCQFGMALRNSRWLVLFLCSLAASLVFGGTMYLSKKHDLPWKVAELLTGGAVGLVTTLTIFL